MAGSKVRTFSCPACGGSVALRAAGHSVTAVCSYCSTLIDTANEHFSIIKKFSEKNLQTKLPIGARGVLDDVQWEVIGYVQKEDAASHFRWEEYLLFNPYHGFRFLVHSDRHWSLAVILKRDLPVTESADEITLDGNDRFRIYGRGDAIVQYVKGEFYWRVRKDDRDAYADYIAPPRMLTIERNKQEVTYSLSHYLPHQTIAQAFGVELDKPIGVAPNQPPPLQNVLGGLWKTAMLAVLAALLIHLGSGIGKESEEMYLHLVPGSAGRMYQETTFTMPRQGNVLVETRAPLNNNWMELDLSLVDESTQNAMFTGQVIEYYHGVDGGESWSEGSQSEGSYFPEVPAGKYRLLVEPTVGALPAGGMSVALKVGRNVPPWGNFWTIVLLILALPLVGLIRRWRFEYKRWGDSDHAPALYRRGEDE